MEVTTRNWRVYRKGFWFAYCRDSPVSDVSPMGRATHGAKVMELKAGDEVGSVAVVSGEE